MFSGPIQYLWYLALGLWQRILRVLWGGGGGASVPLHPTNAPLGWDMRSLEEKTFLVTNFRRIQVSKVQQRHFKQRAVTMHIYNMLNSNSLH